MSRSLKIAFAGTGSIGQRHLGNLLTAVPDAQVIFLRAGARRDVLSDDIGAKLVSNMEELLDCAPDGLIISTPSALHEQTLFGAIKADLPVYIEKPVVTSQVDLDRIHDLLTRHPDLPSLIGCNLRFLPSLRKLHDLAHAGIGTIARASFEAGQWLPDWRPAQDHRQSYSASKEAGGGAILDLLHELDAAEWICGPLKVIAATVLEVPALGIRSEAAANILLKRSDPGALVCVQLDYVARKPVRQYRIVGDRGTLVWSLAERSLRLETPEGDQIIDCGQNGFNTSLTYEHAMSEFLDAVRGGPQTSNPLQTGLPSNALALTAKEIAC